MNKVQRLVHMNYNLRLNFKNPKTNKEKNVIIMYSKFL